MTRKDRYRLQRDRERINAIGGEGIGIEVSPDFRCDECGGPEGTLYELDGRLLCSRDMPFEYRHGNRRHKMISMAVSGKTAIQAKRRQLAVQH
jgi:hypothetical protein